jgi:hypothetical protein
MSLYIVFKINSGRQLQEALAQDEFIDIKMPVVKTLKLWIWPRIKGGEETEALTVAQTHS